jgi:hypothetical protein
LNEKKIRIDFFLQKKTQLIELKISCFKKNQQFLLNFGALSPNLFLDFLARQAPEIILNEYSRNTENALFKWLWKETESFIFSNTQKFVG